MTKYIIYLIMFAILIFELIANKGGGPFSSFIVTTLMSVFWGTAIFYLYDFSMSMAGKNSHYMIRFHSNLKNDLINGAVVGATIFIIIMNAPAPYSLSSIDIAASGLPLIISAILETIQCANIKFVNRKMSTPLIILIAIVQTLIYIFSAWLLLYIFTGKISAIQSLWIQLSILSTAITFFFGAKQVSFILTEQRMEVSPTFLSIFESLPNSPGLYKEMEVLANKWNAEVQKEKVKIWIENKIKTSPTTLP